MNAEAVRRLERSFETSREADLYSISRILSMHIDLYNQVIDNAMRKLESAGINADDLIEGKQIAQMRAMLREVFDMIEASAPAKRNERRPHPAARPRHLAAQAIL
jgi:GTP-sensing pleiotropic transcriptional regulator CodY